MIVAIVRLQSCTTRPGRRAFVPKGRPGHGIAKGKVTAYRVEAKNWAQVRSVVAGVDSTGHRTMGFSTVSPLTVESWSENDNDRSYSTVKPVKP